MRANLLSAIGVGENIAFLGANNVYWRTIMEPNQSGFPNRIARARKFVADTPPDELTTSGNTFLWRDKLNSLPEAAVIGGEYSCVHSDASGVIVDPANWLLIGTSVTLGAVLPHLASGETDTYILKVSPAATEILAHADFPCPPSAPKHWDMTYLTYPSGAAIFNAATTQWVCNLDHSCTVVANDPATESFVKTVTENIVSRFSLGPAGIENPSLGNGPSVYGVKP